LGATSGEWIAVCGKDAGFAFAGGKGKSEDAAGVVRNF
jgi:hypothetical protein